MRLCLQLPWFNANRPYVALHWIRWGVKYFQPGQVNVYKVGVGIGRVEKRELRTHQKSPTWHPEGHWFWRYYDRRKRK